MKTEKILNGITKNRQDKKQAENMTTGNAPAAAEEKPHSDGADLPGSLSEEQVFDLAGGGRPGKPEPPH